MPNIPDDDNLITDESVDPNPEGGEEENDEEDNDTGEESDETKEDDDEGGEDDEKDEESDETAEGTEDENEEEEEEGTDEDEEGTEEDESLSEDEVVSAAKEKYPKLFKEFPDLRKFVYIGKQLSTIFPDVETAEIASNKSEILDGIAFGLAEGNVTPLLNSLKEVDEDGEQLALFADKVLPALHKMDKDLFARATMPVLANAARLLHSVGIRNKDKNIVAAAKIFAKAFFPDGNLPTMSGSGGAEENPEADRLRKQLNAREQREHDNFNNGVRASAYKTVTAEITESLKGKKLSDTARETLIEKIYAEAAARLKKDPTHMRKMLFIQQQAFKHGHTPQIAKKLEQEWLASARPVIRMVQARLVPKFLGEDVKDGKDGKGNKKVKKPLSSGGKGGGGSNKNATTKDGRAPTPDWGAMKKAGISDADYLLGKEIAKK